MTRKRIAVIGAGPCGLAALRQCLDYGQNVEAYEMQSSVGGMWRLDDKQPSSLVTQEQTEYLPAGYKGLIFNTSLYTSFFSDFPFNDDMEYFPRLESYRKYLEEYATKFNLTKHIRLSTKVVNVTRRDAEFTVHFCDVGRTEVLYKRVFDHVIVASGRFGYPNVPNYPGIREAAEVAGGMRIMHNAELIDSDATFCGKRVLVIGGSTSGGDVAEVALRHGATKVYWSISRRPTKQSVFVLDPFPPTSDRPRDSYRTRFVDKFLPFFTKYQKLFSLPAIHKKGTWQFGVDPVADTCVVCDWWYMKECLKNETLELTAPVEEFCGETSRVVLKDGKSLSVDVVVLATGFHQRYPFLAQLWPYEEQEKNRLYKFVLPVDKEVRGIGIVYTTRIAGSGLPLSEMESRWLVHNWSRGTWTDADYQKFTTDVNSRYEHASVIRRDNFNSTDELAREVGCFPRVWSRLLSWSREERRLGLSILHGPLIPAHFRLDGQHTWCDAAAVVEKFACRKLGKKKFLALEVTWTCIYVMVPLLLGLLLLSSFV